MLTAIMGIWTGLPGPVKKIAEYAALLALAFWIFKVFWLNKHDNDVAAKATTETTDKVAKDQEAIWKPQLEKLKTDNADLAKQVTTAVAQRDELARSRETMVSALNTVITQSRTIQEGRRGQVDLIPSSQLDGALRDLSNQLAATAPATPTTPK